MSISQGPEALDVFNRSWSTLMAEFHEATCRNTVDDETLSFAHQVFSRIEILAKRFLDLDEAAENVTGSLQNDLDVIFRDLSLTDDHSSASSGVFAITLHCHRHHLTNY